MLSLVVGGNERAHQLLTEALRSSGHRDLPREPAELCTFARAHLTYPLIDELGPRLAATTIDELVRELAPTRDEAPSSTREQDDESPSSSVRSVEPKPMGVALGRLGTRRKAAEEVVSSVRAPKTDRPKIAIVERNAFVRSSLSRALVRAGYDVAHIDRLEQLQSEDRYEVVLVSLRGADVDAALAAVLALEPSVALVAYFADETNLAALRRSGATNALVVSALSPLDQVVASVASAVASDTPPPSSRR